MTGFLTRLCVELVDPLAHGGQGEWQIERSLVYVSKKGVRYVVPAGFMTDLASVPRAPIVYWLDGNTAHAPSALHDWLLTSGTVTRAEADELFYEAMESIGMPQSRVGRMYRAVSAHTRNLARRLNPWAESEQ